MLQKRLPEKRQVPKPAWKAGSHKDAFKKATDWEQRNATEIYNSVALRFFIVNKKMIRKHFEYWLKLQA